MQQEVIIVGGGMVGLAVACGLQGSGLRVAVIEQAGPAPVDADAAPELRVSAINAASEKLLAKLGVWEAILALRASRYHGMEVWDRDSFGRIALMRDAQGLFVRRDLSASPWWLRLPAWRLARREALALRQLVGQAQTPQLLGWDGTYLDRSFLDGVAMYKNPPRGDLAYFRAARRLLLWRNGQFHAAS